MVLKNGRTWAKNLIFWLVLESFLSTPSYHLWVTNQVFGKNWGLVKKKIVVSFISITFVAVKLRIFKVCWTNSASMKWSFLGRVWALNPPIWLSLAEIFTGGRLHEDKKSFWRIFQTFWILTEAGRTQILQFWSIFRPNVTPEKPKYC